MKKLVVSFGAVALVVAAAAFAQNAKDINVNAGKFLPKVAQNAGGGGGGSNLTFHSGGKVLRNAHVIMIFWGFGNGNTYTSTLQNYRNQYGTNREYAVVTQYYGYDDNDGSYGNIQGTNLAGSVHPDYFDTSTPPTNVTDATVQSEVKKVIAAQGGTDYAAIYEVFIPSSSYSSDGTSTSCGGPNLAYCAYHSHYVDSSNRNVKYSIQPWAGCSGCQSFGDVTLDQEHFVCHETREAVTDSLGNAWYDRRGYEADDKCAWSPAPFTDGSYGYQYEWSNSVGGCVKY